MNYQSHALRNQKEKLHQQYKIDKKHVHRILRRETVSKPVVSNDNPTYKSPTPISQEKVYFKNGFNKEHSWTKKDQVESGSGSSEPLGKWITMQYIDDDGKPKTTKAWVLFDN